MSLSNVKHILSTTDFSREFLDRIYVLTNTIRRMDKSKEGLHYLRSILMEKRAMLYFTQPSTRTFLSFQSACHILGISSSEIRDSSTSSERKGESIDDSLRTFSSYVDLIIMRTPVPGLCDRVAKLLDDTPRPVPIINAGSGPDEHPTQAILDIYTLQRSFKDSGGIDGKTVLFVGDLKNGRTIRSLSKLLCLYKDTKIIFCSPESFRIQSDLKDQLTKSDQQFSETTDFQASLEKCDAVYMTRVQDEYDPSSANVDYSDYCLKESHLELLKKDAVIMHPLPRRDELDPKIDNDPRAKYWRQERNGMWTRAALITMILGVDSKIVLPEL